MPTRLISGEQAVQLLQLQESYFADVKALEIQPAKLSRTISGFANAAGGEIYIGFDEELTVDGAQRTWRGFPNEEAANAIIHVLESLAPLANYYSYQFLESDGYSGLVLQLTIHKTAQILPATEGKYYVRKNASNLPVADEAALTRLKYEKGILSFEDEVLNADSNDIENSETIIEFMLEIIPTSEPEDWLKKQKLLIDGKPTVAGTLLFADEPQISLPKRSAVKVYRYNSKGVGERATLAFDPITVEGPIYNLIYESIEKTREVIESIKRLGEKDLERINYPDEALHEIITNAILHRDYSITSDVHIRIFDNRVEIESPGKFPGHVTPQNVLKEQFARNPKLVRLINKFPDAPNKDVGEGINTAFEAMEKIRLRPPEIQELENSVLVVLKHESLGSPEQLVMAYLEENETITNSKAREITGIKSENTQKRVFYRLRDRGMIEQVPESRQRWRKKSSLTLFSN